MTVPLRFVNNPWKIEERNLCFVNAPTQVFLNLELTKKHFLGKSLSDLAKKPISAEIKRLLGCNPRSVESLKELRRLVGISRGKRYTALVHRRTLMSSLPFCLIPLEERETNIYLVNFQTVLNLLQLILPLQMRSVTMDIFTLQVLSKMI